MGREGDFGEVGEGKEYDQNILYEKLKKTNMTSCLQPRFLKAASSYLQVLCKNKKYNCITQLRLGSHLKISNYGYSNIPKYNKNT